MELLCRTKWWRTLGFIACCFFIASMSCVTIRIKETPPDDFFCKQNKSYDFYVSIYNKIPSGTTIEKISLLQSQNTFFSVYLKNEFMKELSNRPVKATKEGKYEFGTEGFKSVGVDKYEPYAPGAKDLFKIRVASQKFLIPTSLISPYSFVLCNEIQCNTLIDPVNGSAVSSSKKYFSGLSSRVIYGYTPSGIHQSAKQGSADGLYYFVWETGFNLGEFIRTHYFSVPAMKRQELCKATGEATNCFAKIPTHYEPPSWISDTNMRKVITESNYGISLIMKASTRTSTTTKGDWTIHKITWNPSLMCQYAKSTQDFVSH